MLVPDPEIYTLNECYITKDGAIHKVQGMKLSLDREVGSVQFIIQKLMDCGCWRVEQRLCKDVLEGGDDFTSSQVPTSSFNDRLPLALDSLAQDLLSGGRTGCSFCF
jgi:hypothetical protein